MAYEIPSRVLVIGLGSSGLAAARLAADDGAEVWVTDQRSEGELAETLDSLPGGVRVFAGGHPESSLDGVGLVVASPGVPPDCRLLRSAVARGIAVATELEFAWHHRRDAPLAAVTGSNGKSTVTELVAHMLREDGEDVTAGGNLGTPASQMVLDGGWKSWVLEVSSFQAELLTAMAPQAAVFLNLSQDHLERHPDMPSYLAAKRRLFAFQSARDVAVLNADDPAVAATVTRAAKQMFSQEGDADARCREGVLLLHGAPLIETSEMKMTGAHNLANALAASLAAAALGATPAGMASALSRFEGLEHRHRVVISAGGVTWVDDSKATNVGATLAALKGYPEESVHLILGGQAKGQDFGPLVEEIRRAVVRLYLIGEDGPAIGECLAGSAPAEWCDTLEEAARRARAAAASQQWVVLAPACASFDQFADFGQRGDRFAALAREEVASCP